MLDKSVYYFRSARSILFLMENTNSADPDQVHCLPMTLYRFPGKNGLMSKLN